MKKLVLQYAIGRQGVEACVAVWSPGSHAASGVFACRSHPVNLLRWPVHMTNQCAPAWVPSQCFRAKCSACNHELGVRRGELADMEKTVSTARCTARTCSWNPSEVLQLSTACTAGGGVRSRRLGGSWGAPGSGRGAHQRAACARGCACHQSRGRRRRCAVRTALLPVAQAHTGLKPDCARLLLP